MSVSGEHSGHRARMRKKYLENGIEIFEPHEILELLLFYVVPMKDTNALAHKLLNHFGSLSAIFDAPTDLLTTEGLTENQAVFLKLIPDITRVYINDKHDSSDKIIDPDNIAEYMIRKFIGKNDECVILLLLDSKFRELFCGVVAEGDFAASMISVRKVIDLALRYKASAAVIAHNHPSGIAAPSRQDVEATVELMDALHLIGVHLLDHFVVSDNDCVSIMYK